MRAIGLIIAAAALVAPAAAHASGGGLTAGFGGKGAAGDQYTYVAIGGGNTSTIQMIRRDGGAVERFRQLKGIFGVPQVAYDGSTTGLSHDGGTLVLSDVPHTYPVKQTRLLVLDARTLETEQRINLRGWYSVDALSPSGETIYLVHYNQPTIDPQAYEVLAYDRASGRRDVIMDPDEPEEQMSGMPLFRVTSADGRYEFTLYDNPEEPFIHMLDTAGHSAQCIDLGQLKGHDLSNSPLRLDGGTVRIGDLATLDPETQTVTLARAQAAATPPPRATATPARRQDTGGLSPWPLVALGLVVLLAVAVVLGRRRSGHEVVDLEVTAHHPDEEPALRR